MARAHYAVYDDATGEVLRVGRCATHIVTMQAGLGESALETDGSIRDDVHYLDLTSSPPVWTMRPVMPLVTDKTGIAADGIDAATVTSVPSGAVLTIPGTAIRDQIIDDGKAVFRTQVPGRYELRFRRFPYLDGSVNINAT